VTVPLADVTVNASALGTSGVWSVSFDRPHDAVGTTLAKLAASGQAALDGSITAKRVAPLDGGHEASPYATWAFHNVVVQSYSETQNGDGGQDVGSIGFTASSSTPTFTLDRTMLPDPTLRPAGTITYNLPGGAVTSPIYAASWGVGPSGPGPATFSDLAITQPLDASTPGLLTLVRSGQTMLSATVKFQDPSEAQPHLTYVLKNAGVASLTEGSAQPAQTTALTYDQITTTTRDADGHSTSTCWDLTTNAAC
jgi:type VI protein secretion system component Hcp